MARAKPGWIFGRKPVLELLADGADLEKILVAKRASGSAIKEIVTQARALGVPVQFVPSAKLDREVRANHQGVLALQSAVHYYRIDDVLPAIYDKGEVPLILLLDRISDVRNLGAIARSAYGAGVNAIVVPQRESAPLHGDAMKASAGALQHLPVCRHDKISAAVRLLQTNGLLVVGLAATGGQQLKEVDLTQPLALVIGSEYDGLSAEVKKMMDRIVRLPMVNEFDSYNVSVATGMALYEIMRQRLP